MSPKFLAQLWQPAYQEMHDADFLDLFVQVIDHYITYSIISSNPGLSYSSVLSTVRCYPVTSGDHEGSTFVTWSGNFSNDADAGQPFPK
jgi:hypothetical protein